MGKEKSDCLPQPAKTSTQGRQDVVPASDIPGAGTLEQMSLGWSLIPCLTAH